ncbi:NAD-dependent deacylase [Sporosarcina sp. Te-1]|uniref:NAD-dependent deacylase n=1 Tax=Sporosarcina sp. Te-1 TaxID=2818390 RepID=UPI001A9E2D5B|nr:NAD-dependent deacylase [Sporosarcina sp. Te-1]QTD41347.1 NAD-dependent deacylase [Sporosarcina sp. Te-1]
MLADLIRNSNHTIVFTGAGMSTESGLPDFRSSNTGLWGQEDPSQVASTEALNKNVEQFFRFYRHRVLGVQDCMPHAGHFILAEWERKGLIQGIITQNVDGFHTEAGTINSMELHGTLQKVHCQSCGKDFGSDRYTEEQFYCPCGGTLRPSVVLFGEMLSEDTFTKAIQETEKSKLFIVLGSSLTVSPANQFPLLAKEHGAKLVIVNREPTMLDRYADMVINGKDIGEVLSEVDSELKMDL